MTWNALGKAFQYDILSGVEINLNFIVAHRTSYVKLLLALLIFLVVHQTSPLDEAHRTRPIGRGPSDEAHRTRHIGLGPSD